MKIGIVTLNIRENYGGIMQAYALQTALEQLGNSVNIITINRYKKPELIPDAIYRRFITYPIRFLKKMLLGRKNLVIRYEHQVNETKLNLMKYTEQFVQKYLHIDDYNSFLEIPKGKYDAFVVGSDQVWRKIYFNDVASIENAFLSFAENWEVKRLSYAASFGIDNINEYIESEKELCAKLLQQFDAVSVRELSGVRICQEYFSVKSKLVVDPTLLLDKADYLKLIPNSEPHIKKGLFYYVLDENEELNAEIFCCANKNKLTPFRVNAYPMTYNGPLENRIQRPVSEWLNAFNSADLIITDSFHACVFSIIFNKQFYVIENKKRGISRIDSLLQTFGLANRKVAVQDVRDIEYSEIDWGRINTIKSDISKDSLSFLDNNLQK